LDLDERCRVMLDMYRGISRYQKGRAGKTQVIVCNNVPTGIEGSSTSYLLLPEDGDRPGETDICCFHRLLSMLWYITKHCKY